MTRRWVQAATFIAAYTFVGCTSIQPNNEILLNSFTDQIASSTFVTDFVRDGNELRFYGPNGKGGEAAWLVRIETVLVESNEFDPVAPYYGRIRSEWAADGTVVEYLGSMTALPQEFLDRGVGQECWAYWLAAEKRWDW